MTGSHSGIHVKRKSTSKLIFPISNLVYSLKNLQIRMKFVFMRQRMLKIPDPLTFLRGKFIMVCMVGNVKYQFLLG